MAKRRGKSGRSQLTGTSVLILIIILVVASFLGIDVGELLNIVLGEQTAGEVVRAPQTDTVEGQWYQIYFTNPTCPDEEQRRGGVDEIIAEDMLAATRRVDVAGFDFDSEPMLDALLELEERGVEVRFVTDDEHNPAGTTNRLRRNGISVVADQRSALMHNKFVIIDGQYLWVGSLNFTSNGVYCNNNNVVRITSPRLAANYTLEMDEMYTGREFGPTSSQNTSDRFTINGVEVENYFASEDDLAPKIARLIARADNEILFMAFSFTNEIIGEAMRERAEADVEIRGVFETVGSETRFSYYGELVDVNLPNVAVRQDGNPRIMHHKVIVIDRQTVIFGSYNFSGSANDANDENVLVVHDPAFAGFFVEEFEMVWQAAAGE